MSGIDAARDSALSSVGSPALLVVDVQHDFADPSVLSGWGVEQAGLDAVAAAVSRTAALVDAARSAGVPVVWVELAYDPARPWHSSAWLQTGSPQADTDGFPCVAGTPGAAWWGVAPAEGETRVRKRFYSGFAGTGLAEALKHAGVGWLAVAGLTTECCIQATVTDAFQHDFPVVVARDATAAYTAELHESALNSMALNTATVRTADEIVALWSGRS